MNNQLTRNKRFENVLSKLGHFKNSISRLSTMELDFDELFVFVVHFVRGSLIHPYIVILLENHMIYFQGTRDNENIEYNFTNVRLEAGYNSWYLSYQSVSPINSDKTVRLETSTAITYGP